MAEDPATSQPHAPMLWPGHKTVKQYRLHPGLRQFLNQQSSSPWPSSQPSTWQSQCPVKELPGWRAGRRKTVIVDSRNRHRFKSNIPPRNIIATVKLSDSATKRNAAIATKLNMEFGCIKYINSPANCSRLRFVARPYELPIPLNFNLADQQAAQRHEHRDPRVGAAVLRRRAPRLQPSPSRQI